MKVLEKMLHIETEAQQIVEDAKAEANAIRKKAREDAKQLVIDGKHRMQEQIQQEIKGLEEEADARKKQIIQETEQSLAALKQVAQERMNKTVEHVVSLILKQEGL